MTEFLRTPDTNFKGLEDFPWAPNYHQWKDLRMHYIDEGPKDAPVMLLMHGMPTWSFLYRHVIPRLLDAGYRCVAPDHMGFGKSDKPIDLNWYTIARHTEVLTSLITALDLNDITLVCQDWGGPTGLAQAVFMPERFSRLTIMNTWLHHPEYEYSEAIRNWNKNWHEGGMFCREKPDMGALMLLSGGFVPREQAFGAILQGTELQLEGEALNVYNGFRAPINDMPDEAFNGMRRFPLSICFDNYDGGNGAAQTHFYKTLLNWNKPVHFIWGCADDVFTEAWGRQWAQLMGATFTPIEMAGHFLQNTHGDELAGHLLQRITEEN
jgi:haloalkane dehalogenase